MLAVGQLTIGQLAEQSGTPATKLRYYDRIGLLVPERTTNGYRRYLPDAVERLRLITLCQALGFTLAEIGALLFAGATEHRRAVARAKLSEVRDQQARLQAASAVLGHLSECEHLGSEGELCRRTIRSLLGQLASPAPLSLRGE
ncbi:MAG: MerR family transcriptional regulator [Nocardioides sp.]